MKLLRSMCLLLVCFSTAPHAGETTPDEAVVGEFLLLLLGDEAGRADALDFVADTWSPGYPAMMLEVMTFNRDPRLAGALRGLMEERTGQRRGNDLRAWQQWLWSQPEQRHSAYAEFKSALYGLLDPAFESYFNGPASIRLDEVLWGGVAQDGIPPLRDPAMVSAKEADYLREGDLVFGISVNGDHRAYPRRILGWHELFTDTVGDIPVAGVYCTLCGTLMLYQTVSTGVHHLLGTSGFLYRSNKLMYDRATQSLWSTFRGQPVIGPLADKGIELTHLPVVTTTWKSWRTRHPDTLVLSLETGYSRDYREGAAYRDYYATDDLMFPVPGRDTRLPNKAEVLGIALPGAPRDVLAITIDYLHRHPLLHRTLGSRQLVVLADRGGAMRVYEAGDIRFKHWDREAELLDTSGKRWRMEEGSLLASDGRRLPRLPAQRAFWFGWQAAYPETALLRLDISQ